MKEQTDCPSSLLHDWGKAAPGYPSEPKWHPLIYHCLAERQAKPAACAVVSPGVM